MSDMRKVLRKFVSSKTSKGIARGLYSPGSVFAHEPILPNPKYDGSVEKAWADVGAVFSQVLKQENDLGKKASTRRDPKAKIPA